MNDLATMPKYEAYKDSGDEVIGEIPINWEMAKLRYLGAFSASGIDKLVKQNESKVKIVNFTDISSNKESILSSDRSYMEVTTPEANKKKHLVRKGDLIFLPSSETYEDLGLSALINENIEDLSFSYHVIRFNFIEEVVHGFKKYLTNNSSVMAQFSRQGKGTTRKIIGRNIFKNIMVPIPSIPEQHRIANFLDKKTAQIDEVIAIKEKQIELLKERKQIIIQQAVTQGLNPDVPMKDSGVDWIGEVPEHWEVTRFKNIFTQSRLPISQGDGVVTSFRDGQVTLRSKRRLTGFTEAIIEGGYQGIRKGQLVLNSMDAFEGAIGVSDSDGKCTPEYVICNPKSENISQYYFSYLLRQMALAKYIQVICNAVRQRAVRIRFNNLAFRLMVLPPLSEQNETVQYIKYESEKIDSGVAHLQSQIDKFKEYKTTLINSAVTGKIKVS